MEINQFLSLSTQSVKDIVESKKTKKNTIVFAYDGTRRSFLIEEAIKTIGSTTTSSSNDASSMNPNSDIKIDYSQYSKTAFKKLLHHLVMMFQHGIQTIVYPMWFCTLEKRGPEYLPKFIQYLWGVVAILDDEHLFNLYQSEGIRVIFYGEYIDLLHRGKDFELLEKFELIMEKTKHNTKKIILFGTNIEEPSNTLIKNTLFYYSKFGKVPNKNELIKQYYGVEVEDVSMYIGFDRFSTDGRPILISDKGNEDLYYTVSPHSFLSQNQFRKILFDHLFCRSVTNAKEYELKLSDIQAMKEFYQSNCDSVMGIGAIQSGANFWYPTNQLCESTSASTSSSPFSSSPSGSTIVSPPPSRSLSPSTTNSLRVLIESNRISISGGGSCDNSASGYSSLMSSADSGSCENIGYTPPPLSPKFYRNHSNSTSPSSSTSLSSSTSTSSPPLSPTSDSIPSSPTSLRSSVSNKNLSPTLLMRMQPFLQSN